MRTLLVVLVLLPATWAAAKRVGPLYCEGGPTRELASQATRVYAGSVKSIDHGEAVVAVTDVWKGGTAATETRPKSECAALQKVGNKVIVLELPSTVGVKIRSGCTSICIGSYADSAVNRRILEDSFGPPSHP